MSEESSSQVTPEAEAEETMAGASSPPIPPPSPSSSPNNTGNDISGGGGDGDGSGSATPEPELVAETTCTPVGAGSSGSDNDEALKVQAEGADSDNSRVQDPPNNNNKEGGGGASSSSSDGGMSMERNASRGAAAAGAVGSDGEVAVAPIDFSDGATGSNSNGEQHRQQQTTTSGSEAERMAAYFDDEGDGGGVDASGSNSGGTRDDGSSSTATPSGEVASAPLPATDGSDGGSADPTAPTSPSAAATDSNDNTDNSANADGTTVTNTQKSDPTRAAAQHMAAVAAAALASSQGATSPSAAADYAKQLMPGVVPSHGAAPLSLPGGAGAGSSNVGGGAGGGAYGPTRVTMMPPKIRRETVNVDGVRRMMLEEDQQQLLLRRRQDQNNGKVEEEGEEGDAQKEEGKEEDQVVEVVEDQTSAAASSSSCSSIAGTVMRTRVSTDDGFEAFLRHLMLLSDVLPEPPKAREGVVGTATSVPSTIGVDAEKKDTDNNEDENNDSSGGGGAEAQEKLEKQRRREAEAASSVVQTLAHAEAAYDDLFAMLPTLLEVAAAAATAAAAGTATATDDKSPSGEEFNAPTLLDGNGEGDSENKAVDADVPAANSAPVTDADIIAAASDEEDHEYKVDDSLDTSLDSAGTLDDGPELAEGNDEDVDDDTVYDYGESSLAARRIVPDLLPPCMSAGGDATSAFFRACRGPPEEEGEAESASAIDGKAADDSSPLASTADLSTTSSAQQPSGGGVGRAAFGLGSLVSSVKTRAAGGRKGGSPKNDGGDGNERGGMFGRLRKTPHIPDASEQKHPQRETSSGPPTSLALPEAAPQDPNKTGRNYTVQIDREMLGLTVENVLERTVVRTVLPGGAAKRAGARVGSLIVKVGSVETANLTHFETIDELRQSQRPLKLVLRQIGENALRGAREEMGRLIRGGGFGMAASEASGGDESKSQEDGAATADASGERDTPASALEAGAAEAKSEPIRLSPEAEKFESSLHGLWMDATRRRCRQQPGGMPNKRDEAISAAGEKLVWILTLLVIGLEREAVRLEERENAAAELSSPQLLQSDSLSVGTASTSSSGRHKHSHHTSKDYTDAARSVSKQLLDYVKRHVEEDKPPEPALANIAGAGTGMPGGAMQNPRRKRQPPPPPHVPMAKQLANSKAGGAQSGPPNNFDRSLQSIGDVLHRSMTFLADPSSPPAALLRGEVIALLCDILDADTDMRLADEESASSVAGGNAAPINELGSAGSLLKLIVLNCSMMRSTGCVDPPHSDSAEEKKANDDIYGDAASSAHHAHAGNRFLAVVHRLAASRSTSARVTACSLGPVLWAHLDFPHQLQLRGVITRALHDVEVIVRKSTATVLHEIAELVFDSRSVPWLVLMCERAMTDPEPQLRAAAMTLTWHLAEHLPNAFLGDASKGSRALRRLPPRSDPTFAEVYLLQCKLLPVATRLAEDRAPAVRLAVAAQCDRLCNALGDHWFNIIIDLLQALLGDTDERVRGEAMLCMPRLVDSVLSGTLSSSNPSASTNVLDSLLPLAIKLLKDPSTNVRVSLATACGELLTLLVGLTSQEEIFQPPPSPGGSGSVESSSDSDLLAGVRQHKRHIDETLIPLVQRLLHDTDPEVTSAALRAVTNASRGNVREISTKRSFGRSHSVDMDDTMSVSSQFSYASIERKEPVFIPVLSEQQVLRLLPTLSDLSENPQWRVRQSAVEIVPALLGCTHLLETRSEIAQLCVELMDDEVDAVRRTAAECLCLGGGSLARHGEDDGGQWISAIVIPQLRNCSKSQKYKQRMLSLKMVEVVLVNSMCPPAKSKARTVVVDADGKESAIPPLKAILDIAASLAEDIVVNVRLNVGRVFASIAHHPVLEEEELNFIVEIVEKQLRTEQVKERGGDRDVVFFAKQAAAIVRNRLEETSLSHDDASLSLASTTTN